MEKQGEVRNKGGDVREVRWREKERGKAKEEEKGRKEQEGIMEIRRE
jgi:hypothetical protein